MCPHDAERCDVAVRNAVGRIFFHFREDVADNLGRIVGCLFRSRNVDGDVT
jgi:hypothetical protein